MAMRLWASSTANALNLCRSNGAPTAVFPTYRRFSSSVLDGFKYSSSHEWVKHEGSVATVGITDHAQGHLGEVVFVELPESGTAVSKGGSFGAVESVKATSDINSPISRYITEYKCWCRHCSHDFTLCHQRSGSPLRAAGNFEVVMHGLRRGREGAASDKSRPPATATLIASDFIDHSKMITKDRSPLGEVRNTKKGTSLCPQQTLVGFGGPFQGTVHPY